VEGIHTHTPNGLLSDSIAVIICNTLSRVDVDNIEAIVYPSAPIGPIINMESDSTDQAYFDWKLMAVSNAVWQFNGHVANPESLKKEIAYSSLSQCREHFVKMKYLINLQSELYMQGQF